MKPRAMAIPARQMTAAIWGALWGSVPFWYATSFNAQPVYMASIATGLMAISRFNIKLRSWSLIPAAVIGLYIFQSLLVETFSGAPSAGPYIAYAVFAFNMTLLLGTLNEIGIKTFFRSFFITTVLSACAHIGLVSIGEIPNHYGRFYFIGGSHPNLGGEIFCVSAIAGALYVKRAQFVLCLLPILYSTLLTQSRTAIVIIAAIALIKIFLPQGGRFSLRSAAATVFAAAALLVASVYSGFLVRFIAQDVLRVSDAHRGLSTGLLSGRNERWEMGVHDFASSPVLGNGISFYSGAADTPHNAFLYSLSQLGISSVIFWIIFFASWAALAARKNILALYAVPAFAMLILNDRFINNNPYPFLFYCILFLYGMSKKSSTRDFVA